MFDAESKLSADSAESLAIFDATQIAQSVVFNNQVTGEIARITPDGIMHFNIAASDENAQAFVECIEGFLARRLSGVVATGK